MTAPQFDYNNIPPELQARRQWVLWGVGKNLDAKAVKIPRQAKNPTGPNASSTNPQTWASFQEAHAWYQIGDARGIGYEVTPADGLVAVDIDHCLDTAGNLLPPFDTWHKALPGYWELSQSGTGLHGFVRGTLPAGCKHKAHIKADSDQAVELYTNERYLALTGALWGPQTPLAEAPSAQAGIDAILEQMHMRPEDAPAGAALPDVSDQPAEKVDEILQRALSYDPDFAQLYHNTDHDCDESMFDHALVCAAARAVNFQLSANDLCKVLDDSPWVQSKDAEHIHKWHDRADYVARTIAEAWAASAQKEADRLDGFAALAANLPAGGVFTAAALDKMDLPPVQWAVPGLLPAGLSFLVAAPKMGKSWMALDLCLAVASGGEWLGRKVNQGPTLYLDLEDSANRAQARMRTLLDGFTAAPETCTFRLLAPILGPDLFKILDEWVTANPGAKVVCIDTFQKIKPATGKNETSYSADYRICAPLQSWAQQYNICVLLVHHTNKNKGSTDIFEGINGSQGLMGSADAVLMLTKGDGRFAEEATLSVTGRDVDMNQYAARFNKANCRWELLGTIEEQALQSFESNPAVLTIKDLTAGGEWKGTVQELAEEVLERYPDTDLPETAQGLRSYFSRVWPNLKYAGIEHKANRGAKQRTHILRKTR